jgi:lycopene cyclase domain-containing protein
MGQYTYLGVLVFIFVGSGWLEFVIRSNVARRARRWALAVLPAFTVFVVWDLYAIAAGHWHFDPEQTVGLVFPGGIPLEELLFFVIVPTAGILTLEAVRAVYGWPAGDEARPEHQESGA